MSKTYDELKRAEHARHVGNFVGANVVIRGDITGDEDLLVDGVVEGLIQLGQGTLTVGATGRIVSDVVARGVIVYGEVRGNIVASKWIELKRESSTVGDLATPWITVEQGANYKGSMEIVSRRDSRPAFELPASSSQPTQEKEQEQQSKALAAAG